MISILWNAGFGVPETTSRQTNRVPACSVSPAAVPSAGHGSASCAFAKRFCATHNASVRALSVDALSADCASARIPAASATATIANATRISTSVKPAR